METCGPYEVLLDQRGLVVAIGSRLSSLTAVPANDLIGKPVTRWLRGAAVTGPPGVTSALELRAENRSPVHGVGVRFLEGDRARITFVPDPARAEGARSRDANATDQRLAEVGREIQDALTGIIGFAGLVSVAPTPHRRKFYVDQVVSQSDRVRRLAQAYDPSSARGGDSASRAHEQSSAPFVRPADLGGELSRALSGLRTQLERGGIGFDFELPQEPVWTACDIRQVGDLVTALLLRATVQQRRDYQANEVVLSVRRGSGTGAPAQIVLILTGADQPQALMRDRFGTGEESSSASMSEAELRVGLASLQRQGGQFTMAHDAQREEVRLTISLPTAVAPRRADKLRTPVPLDVLVVDDDAMLGELYQEMLQVAGHSVTACRSILAAREALRGQRYDAVVAEFQLKDGLLSELWAMASQAHPELASRLIVATRDARDARLIEWASQENTPILAKPFAAPALMEQLALLML